jgi:uncharacterized damage-inducible protein DinB
MLRLGWSRHYGPESTSDASIEMARTHQRILVANTDLEMFLSALDSTTESWRLELGKVPDEWMTYQPRQGGHSLATVLLHMIAVEEWWIQEVAGGTPMSESRRRELLDNETNQDDGIWPDPPQRSLKSLCEMQDATRQVTKRVVAEIGNIEAVTTMTWDDSRYEYNLRWILYHVAEHEAWHGGQLLLLADLASAHFA